MDGTPSTGRKSSGGWLSSKRAFTEPSGVAIVYCAGDVLEVDHTIPTAFGGKDGYDNWQLLHGHCHDEKTAEDRHRYQAPDY
jgi:hypothetical protein